MNKKGQTTKYALLLRTVGILFPLLLVFTAPLPVLAAPIINLSTSVGAAGTSVLITGTNFDSYRGDQVSVLFDNDEIPGSPLEVPQTGTFTIDFIVPATASAGRHLIKVRSELGSTLASSPFIIPASLVTLDKAEGPVGTAVTVTGEGYYANRLVTIYFFTRISERMGTAMADAVGKFSFRFNVPSSPAGMHQIEVENNEGDTAETAFEVTPSLQLNLVSGAPGDIVTVSGAGFGYRRDVNIFFNDIETAYAKSNEFGNFSVTFNVPEITSGSYEIRAIDRDDNTEILKFTVTAGASISTDTGAVGTPLLVKGIGFKAKETVIIKYGEIEVATATTDGNGAFSSTFPIPASQSGGHQITITDGTTTRVFTFGVESAPPPIPSPLLPPNAGRSKAKAHLDWADVTDASMPVTYRLQIAADVNFAKTVLDRESVRESQYSLNDAEKLVAVKHDTPYYWRVKAVDAAGNAGAWSPPSSFYVAAPTVPALLQPATGSKADAETLFDWEDASSLSPPVGYQLEAATDANFQNILLDKEGLSASEYRVTPSEKLPAVKKEAPYYWRVKTIDSEGNESEWSAPQSFYVGFAFTVPPWALYTLIGAVVLIIGLFAFWIGRRTAYYQEEI
ncbi:MAG: hypothetical protein ABID87_08445 [Chloroflexota bacterium]